MLLRLTPFLRTLAPRLPQLRTMATTTTSRPSSPKGDDSNPAAKPPSPKRSSPAPRAKNEPFQPLGGLLAINKPRGISSAQAMREIMDQFNTSEIFASTLSHEASKRAVENNTQRRRRRNKRVEVKMGHGGTLDPMASGVLVLGIMNGTKQLQAFLTGTKTYEAVALFGCATDTYDALGKIIKRAPWEDVTKQKVEDALVGFRGDIMQKPPLFSALHHEGKRYYEYAREGLPLPVEIQPRPVTTEVLELTGYTDEHEYQMPAEEVSEDLKREAEVLEKGAEAVKEDKAQPGEKRTRSSSPDAAVKKPKFERNLVVEKAGSTESTEDAAAVDPTAPPKNPPIAKLKMSVSKGFYVRSLVYDLGGAVDSAAHMVKLVRTQQGQWELGKNVFEWDDIVGQPEEKWGKRVERALRIWEKEKRATTGEDAE